MKGHSMAARTKWTPERVAQLRGLIETNGLHLAEAAAMLSAWWAPEHVTAIACRYAARKHGIRLTMGRPRKHTEKSV